MKCIPALLVLPFVLFLSGCAGSPYQMRTHPDRTREFTVEADYETVYARIVEPLRARIVPAALTFGSNTGIDADLYARSKAATISAWYTGFGRNYPMVIDMKETAPNKTLVRIYYSNAGAWPSIARNVEAWAQGR
jgi:hypothetical protein